MNDTHKKYRLETVIKNILLESLNRFHSDNLTLSSDEDKMFGWHERPIIYQCIIS